MIPKKIHVLTRYVEILDAETQLTRALICINPHEKSTEYTDLSQVWHDAQEEPEAHRQVVAVDKKGLSFCGKYWSYNNKGYTGVEVDVYPEPYWRIGKMLLNGRILTTCYRKEVRNENMVS